MNAGITDFSMDHYDAVLDLWQKSDGIGLSEADSRENIAVFLERNPGMSFVATANDRIVGAILAGHDGRRGYLYHAAVDADFRGRGIGRALSTRALEALRRAGISKVHIFVYVENNAAFRFWESCGWERREDIQVVSTIL